MTLRYPALIFSLLIIFIVSSFSAFSQATVLYKGSRVFIQRLGSEHERYSNPAGSQMIKDFATALATNPNRLNIAFQCEINYEATVGAEGGLNIRFRIVNGDVRGDTHLRGFNLADVLMPAAFHASFIISTSSGDTLINETRSSLRLLQGNSPHVRYQIEKPAENDTLWLEVRNLFFLHDNQSNHALQEKLQAISNYYAADRLLEKVQKKMSATNCRHQDLLTECFFTLLQAERVINHIHHAGFPEALSLGINDPVQLQRRLEIGRNTNTYLRREFSQILKYTNRIYLTQKEDDLALDYVQGITAFIDGSTGPGFAAVHFVGRLSDADYMKTEFERNARTFRQLSKLISPNLAKDQASRKFLSMIYHAMLLKAGDYITAVDYNKAIVLYENADRFCRAFDEIECRDDASFQIAKARQGLFGFYLSVAGKAIEMQRPDIAESYVFQARDYQRRNSNLIISDEQVMITLIELFDAYLLEAARHNQSGKFDSALYILNRITEPDFNVTPTRSWYEQMNVALNGVLSQRIAFFNGSLDKQPFIVTEALYHGLERFISENLQHQAMSRENMQSLRNLRRMFLKRLVEIAVSDFETGLFDESMRKLLLAASIRGEYRIDAGNEIDSLKILAGREVIREMLDQTVVLINQGKTDDAFLLYEQALQKAKSYHLENDDITGRRLNDIYNAYLSVRCVQLQSRLDLTLIYAQRLASMKEFVMAVDTVNKVMKIIASRQVCDLSLQKTNKFLQTYQPPAEFQQSVTQADKALLRNDYASCLNHIETAAQSYERNELKRFGIGEFSMAIYASNKNSTMLNWYIARRYLQLLRYEQTLEILEMMRKAGSAASETSEIQNELGILTGMRDKGRVGFFESFSKAKDYSGGDSWFRKFHRAYRKGLGYRIFNFL